MDSPAAPDALLARGVSPHVASRLAGNGQYCLDKAVECDRKAAEASNRLAILAALLVPLTTTDDLTRSKRGVSVQLLTGFASVRNETRLSRNCRNVTVAECWYCTVAGIAPLGQSIISHDPARLVIALHKKAPVTVSWPGAFHSAGRVMSFTAT